MNADEMHTIVSSFPLKLCAFAAYSTYYDDDDEVDWFTVIYFNC